MRFDPSHLGWLYEHAISNLSHSSVHVTIMENNQRGFAAQFQRALLQVADSTTVQKNEKQVSFSHTAISVIFLFFIVTLIW